MTDLRTQLLGATALDIETGPAVDQPSEYALQPWRGTEGKAQIDCISIAKADGRSLLEQSDWRGLLQGLEGEYVTTWNGIFDVAWLIASGHWQEVKAIKWVDAMLLWKWYANSQRKERIPKWSLADGAKKFCADEPWLEAFLQMKKEEHTPGGSALYWETRAKLDAIITAKIVEQVIPLLTDRQISSAMIECSSIPEVARSWLMGVPIDFSLLDSIRPAIVTEMRDIEFSLGVSNYAGPAAKRVMEDTAFWTPSKILRSPKQLGALLYGKWKLIAKNFSDKTGEPSTDKAALTYLADDDDRALEILRWRELNTQLSKYIEAPKKARTYLGSDTMHPSPKMFGTYTGRKTYSSKTKKKYQTGVALHQWPRNKQLRALLKPPAGYKHVEYDAAGQESRLMAEKSGDIAMRNVFTKNMDFHSFTGAAISGMSYEAFMKGKEAGNIAIVGEHGYRYAAKFINLSQNFRVGVRKMRIQARVQYGLNVDFLKTKDWQDTFKRMFPGIKIYWSNAIATAKAVGYAETLGGRRFAIDDWSPDMRWSSESSALMFPIQGSGADMSDLGLQQMSEHFPEQLFWFSLHDGLHYLVPEDYPESKILEARAMLNAMDYKAAWGVDLEVPLKWDASVGANWPQLKEL